MRQSIYSSKRFRGITAAVVAFGAALAITQRVDAQTSQLVPANAHARSYGGGWNCSHGSREEHGACAKVEIPANSFLNPSGNDWECNRLYRKTNDACVAIVIPAGFEGTWETIEPCRKWYAIFEAKKA